MSQAGLFAEKFQGDIASLHHEHTQTVALLDGYAGQIHRSGIPLMPIEKYHSFCAVLRQTRADIFDYGDKSLRLESQCSGKGHVERGHAYGAERDQQSVDFISDLLADHQRSEIVRAARE